MHRFSETDEIGLLKECPFLLNCSGNIIRSVADRYFEAAGIQPRIAVESRSIETLLELCLQGMGIVFYPDAFLAGEVRERIPRSMVRPAAAPSGSILSARLRLSRPSFRSMDGNGVHSNRQRNHF